jgi:hypothetical protein
MRGGKTIGDIPGTLCLHEGVTERFDTAEAMANSKKRGLAYSSKMDPRHGPLFTLQSRFTIFCQDTSCG